MEKEKTTTKKVLSIIGNTLLWLFVAFAVLMTIFAISSRSNRDNVPSIGKKIIMPVKTGSMSPAFNAGDLIIVNKVSTEDLNNLKEQDVITFRTRDLDGDGQRDLNSHRIIAVNYHEDGSVRSFNVKGDADPLVEEVALAEIVAVWGGTRIAGVGKFIMFLQTFLGFGLLIVLPLVLFFAFELIMFIRKYLEIKNEGKKTITASDEELIKQKAIEEYLKKQQEEQAQKAQEEPKEEPKEEEKKPEVVEDTLEEVVETDYDE